ncbi:3'-5' exonuclease [Conexibacter woesei]|uniref:3'-5' exonuclease n=1 Tax=Conexibacter woesei TaxID=191495 RepID=UPI000478C753|nr:3'-5' exonuclease [Conexibacter woesei]
MDRLRESDYVVVDVETTGFAADRGDRIVEIALLRCRPGHGVVGRFVTLVDPQVPVRARWVHGIRADDVQRAPRFVDIAAEVRRRLEDAVIVAHNSRFDLAFLDAELSRSGSALPESPTLCTMGLTARLGLPVPGRSLRSCCEHFAIQIDREHGAEHDAQAAAQLLLRLLREALTRGWDDLEDLGCVPAVRRADAPRRSLPQPPDAAPAHRRLVTAARTLGDTWPVADADVAAYLDLLDRVLADRVVTTAEVDALAAMARRCDLEVNVVAAAHREYLGRLVAAAWDDGVLSDDELRDIAEVATLLGIAPGEAAELSSPRRPAWAS